MAARGFLGAGDVYIDVQVNGVPSGLTGPFEASKFAIKPNSTQKDLISKGKTTYGQSIESVALAQPSDFSVDLVEVVGQTLAIALLGTSSVVNQASGSLTAASITFAKLDTWVPSGKVNFTGPVTLTDGASGTPHTYAEGTDYIVNDDLGFVKALSTGSIVAGSTAKISTAYGASAATEISGATVSQIRARFLFDGKNAVDDSPATCDVYEAIMTPSSEFDFLADDFNKVSLTGKMKTPQGYAEPFKVRIGA